MFFAVRWRSCPQSISTPPPTASRSTPALVGLYGLCVEKCIGHRCDARAFALADQVHEVELVAVVQAPQRHVGVRAVDQGALADARSYVSNMSSHVICQVLAYQCNEYTSKLSQEWLKANPMYKLTF